MESTEIALFLFCGFFMELSLEVKIPLEILLDLEEIGLCEPFELDRE